MLRSYYLFWLAIPSLLALATAHAFLLVIAVVAMLGSRWVPDPVLIIRNTRRAHSLRAQVEINPANAVARAELAEIWLEQRRPRRAIPLLEQALERDPESAELHYKLGVAQLRAQRTDAALRSLVDAVSREPKLHYGAGLLALGDALVVARRFDEAVEAYERHVRINSSSLEGMCKLASLGDRANDAAAARRWRREALDSYRALPRFQRRKQTLWWLRAKLGL